MKQTMEESDILIDETFTVHGSIFTGLQKHTQKGSEKDYISGNLKKRWLKSNR